MEICTYCQENVGDTADHVPPKSLFPKPRPQNLVTVPCCEGCRKEQTIDDEYFKTAIVSSRDVSEQDSTQSLVESIKRSLVRPESKGFASLVDKSLVEIDIYTEAGIYVGKTPGFAIEKNRIDRVAERILRGLYRHEYGKSLPLHYDVTNRFNQDGFHQLSEQLGGIQFEPERTIGDVFWYTFAAVPEDEYSTVWLQVYYNALPFLGMTTDPTRKSSE